MTKTDIDIDVDILWKFKEEIGEIVYCSDNEKLLQEVKERIENEDVEIEWCCSVCMGCGVSPMGAHPAESGPKMACHSCGGSGGGYQYHGDVLNVSDQAWKRFEEEMLA